VRDSDGTLLLTGGGSPGTDLTRDIARRLGRPVFSWPADAVEDVGLFRRWLQVYGIRTLNVAGPRESESAGIHLLARRILLAYLGGRNDFAALPQVQKRST
jgi:hypothetical protein